MPKKTWKKITCETEQPLISLRGHPAAAILTWEHWQ